MKTTKIKHPLQPIVIDKRGVARFKENKIVSWLLENGPYDMNIIAAQDFSKDDRWQFAQLIGYSVSGIGDCPYHDRKMLEEADEIVAKLLPIEE